MNYGKQHSDVQMSTFSRTIRVRRPTTKKNSQTKLPGVDRKSPPDDFAPFRYVNIQMLNEVSFLTEYEQPPYRSMTSSTTENIKQKTWTASVAPAKSTYTCFVCVRACAHSSAHVCAHRMHVRVCRRKRSRVRICACTRMRARAKYVNVASDALLCVFQGHLFWSSRKHRL